MGDEQTTLPKLGVEKSSFALCVVLGRHFLIIPGQIEYEMKILGTNEKRSYWAGDRSALRSGELNDPKQIERATLRTIQLDY